MCLRRYITGAWPWLHFPRVSTEKCTKSLELMNDVSRSLARALSGAARARKIKRDSQKDPRGSSGEGGRDRNGRGHRLNYTTMKTRDTTNVREYAYKCRSSKLNMSTDRSFLSLILILLGVLFNLEASWAAFDEEILFRKRYISQALKYNCFKS